MVITNNIKLMVTMHEIPTFDAVGETRNMSDKTGWVSFLCNFVRVNKQHFCLSIHEVKELQKMFCRILQHSFFSEVNKIIYFVSAFE